jgi:CRISPR-associated protein Cst1
MTKLKLTGDFFVDGGGLALMELRRRFPEKSDSEIWDWAGNVYVKVWNPNSLSSVYHTNGITKIKKSDDFRLFVEKLLNEAVNAKGESVCRVCGAQGRTFPQDRQFYPMSGSGKFLNFHHGLDAGTQLCGSCVFQLLFLPFALARTGGKYFLADLQSEAVQKVWLEEVVQANLNKLARGLNDGVISMPAYLAANAVVWTQTKAALQNRDEDSIVQMLEFSNYGANPELHLHRLSPPAARYISLSARDSARDWHHFTSRYSHRKKNAEQDEKLSEEELLWVKWNTVFSKLLSGESLAWELKRYYRAPGTEKPGLMLAINYFMEVLEMNQETVLLVKKIGEAILEMSEQQDDTKKILQLVEQARQPYELRRVLIRLIKKNYKLGKREPLLTTDDYVNYLFPDGSRWYDVRDLLIIWLYQQLHERGIVLDIPAEDAELPVSVENEKQNIEE